MACRFNQEEIDELLEWVAKIKEAVTPSAEPIVRCVECKHLYFKDMSGYCPHMIGPCGPDGFCHYGERRDKNG